MPRPVFPLLQSQCSPFDNLTGSDSQSHIAEGFTEEMIAALGLVAPGRIHVIGRRSVLMLIRDPSLSLANVGTKLGAGHLAGERHSRQREPSACNIKLIHAPTEQQIWAGAYDGPRNGLLTNTYSFCS